ncbi:histidine phosphatase family protein [Marisediminicola sp. LYQ134]|uniref:histidine phosphatase family protein n=1 Tax=unclassified Marisediminicola TaxID=2618316 RepID=UPI003982FFEE
MTRLILVRHGSTEWTDEGRLQGSIDIDLSPSGFAETRALAPAVEALSPGTVVCSPQARAVTTAATLGFHSPDVDPRWAEAGLGDWEGCLPGDLGDDYVQWRRGRTFPPGGEERDSVHTRVLSALEALSRARQPVLVVTHGGVIRSVLDLVVGLDTGSLVAVSPASVTVVDLDSPRSGRLALYNWTPHIALPISSTR